MTLKASDTPQYGMGLRVEEFRIVAGSTWSRATSASRGNHAEKWSLDDLHARMQPSVQDMLHHSVGALFASDWQPSKRVCFGP